jgi:DNA-directed RNA polymerase III subunit RPC1
MEKKEVVVKSSAPKKIAQIQFGTLNSEEIQRVGEFHITSRLLYEMPARNQAPNGCLDPRLGISDKQALCKTCQKKLTDCAGHFGYIQLELPVFHAGYFKHTLTILQCICKRCARVMLPHQEKQNALKKLRNPRIDSLIRGSLFKKTVDTCKRVSRCPYCDYCNGVVKKIGSGCFKIVHEKHRAKHADAQVEHFQKEMHDILKTNPELRPYTQKEVELLNPMRTFELLTQMCDDDMTLMWMNSAYGKPDSLVIWTVPVPPVPIRPSVPQETGGGSTEDDITVKLQEIVEMNNALRMALDKGKCTEIDHT